MIENKFVRMTELDEPIDRCDGTSTYGPCPYKKVPPTNFCPRHGSNKYFEKERKDELNNYRLDKWKYRVGELANNDSIKSLREEVGILRMILEEMLNRCKDTTELLLYSSRMSDLVMRIEKLVVSCDRLENRMGLLLSKNSILQLAAEYVEIINQHVTDPEIIDAISTKMIQVTLTTENPVANN